MDPAQAAQLGLWYYPLMLLLVALDAPVPPTPSEFFVIGAGALAARGLLSLPLAVLAAALGCWLGDIGLYLMFRHGLAAWLHRFRWGRRVRAGILRLLNKAGKSPTYAGLVAVRFISGGRTASMAAAGIAAVPLRPFLALSGAGAVLWSLWMVALGYVTGTTTGLPAWATSLLGMALGTLVGLGTAGYLAYKRRLEGLKSHEHDATTVDNGDHRVDGAAARRGDS